MGQKPRRCWGLPCLTMVLVGWQGSVGVELLRAKALTQLGRQHEALQAARAVLWCVEEEEGGSGKAGEEACALVWDAMDQLPPLRAARYRNASSGSWGRVKHEEHLLVLGYTEKGEAEANASWPLVVSSRSLIGVTVEVCGGLADVEARLQQEEEEDRVVLVAEARSTVLLSDGESVLRRFREGLRDRLLLPASEQQEHASSQGPCDWAPTSRNTVGAGAMLGLAADVKRVVAWAREEERAGPQGLRQTLERLRREQLLGRRTKTPAGGEAAARRG